MGASVWNYVGDSVGLIDGEALGVMVGDEEGAEEGE